MALFHYGVSGMKWGVRRFQDYDGHKIKDGDSFLKENTSITQYTTHKRDRGEK